MFFRTKILQATVRESEDHINPNRQLLYKTRSHRFHELGYVGRSVAEKLIDWVRLNVPPTHYRSYRGRETRRLSNTATRRNCKHFTPLYGVVRGLFTLKCTIPTLDPSTNAAIGPSPAQRRAATLKNPQHHRPADVRRIMEQHERVIGGARGCSGCTCTSPRAVKKIFFRRNLQEKYVRAPPGHEVHPQPEEESILGQFLLGGLDVEVYLDRLWGRRLKKVVNFFWQKSAPQTKS